MAPAIASRSNQELGVSAREKNENTARSLRTWKNRPAVVALIGAFISFATALIAITAVDTWVHRIVLSDLRNGLARTAVATAALIDADNLRYFTHSDQDSTEEYRRASKPLRVILETNPDIRFAYTGVATGDRMHFVLDGSLIDSRDDLGTSEHAAPMREDKASPGELEVTRSKRVTVESTPSPTAWGMGIRAHAPIFSSGGEMVGFVGLTMRADRYSQLVHRSDIAAAFGAGIAFCLALVTGIGILYTQRARETAERSHEASEERLLRERDRLYSYAQALDRSDEEARRKTAKKLQEGIGQTLVGMSMILQSARAHTEQDSMRSFIDQATHAAGEAQNGIGAIIEDLIPPEFERASLIEMMRWLASLFDKRYSFKMQWQIEGSAILSGDWRILIYRIVRELVNNVRLHSGMMQADVLIRLMAGCIELRVKDEGVGFDVSDWSRRSKTVGLVGIQERVHAAGGIFKLHSMLGEGCRIDITIPHSAVDRGDATVDATPKESH